MFLNCYKINIEYISSGKYIKTITDLNGNVFPHSCSECGVPEVYHNSLFWGNSHEYQSPSKELIISRMISNGERYKK